MCVERVLPDQIPQTYKYGNRTESTRTEGLPSELKGTVAWLSPNGAIPAQDNKLCVITESPLRDRGGKRKAGHILCSCQRGVHAKQQELPGLSTLSSE